MRSRRLTTTYGTFLLTCALVTGWPIWALPESAPGAPIPGVLKTALISFPELFCVMTERSAPFAYIGFALQIEGRVRYFKTRTTCQDFKRCDTADASDPCRRPIFGEQITVDGGNIPTRVRRENGDVYDIERSETSTTRSFFLPGVVHGVYEKPEYEDNPHPELVLRECRLLTDASERDLCLWYQAGHQTDDGICEELTEGRRAKCRAWVKNIRKWN